MIAAIDRLGWTHLSCFGHNLNLAVTNALKDEIRVTRAVAVVKRLYNILCIVGKQGGALIQVQNEEVAHNGFCCSAMD